MKNLAILDRKYEIVEEQVKNYFHVIRAKKFMLYVYNEWFAFWFSLLCEIFDILLKILFYVGFPQDFHLKISEASKEFEYLSIYIWDTLSKITFDVC